MKTLLRERVEHTFHENGDSWKFSLEVAGRVGAWRKDAYMSSVRPFVFGPAAALPDVVLDDDEEIVVEEDKAPTTVNQRARFLVHIYEGAPLAGSIAALVRTDSDGVDEDVEFSHEMMEELPDQWVDVLVAEAFRLNPHWSFGVDGDDPKVEGEETPSG